MQGPPLRLCLSVAAGTFEALSRKVERARSYNPDFIELRLDYLTNSSEVEKVRKLLGGNEILTLRGRKEGGRFRGSEKEKVSIIRERVLPLRPKLVDVEIDTLSSFPEIVRDVEKTKTGLVASLHDLKGTRSVQEIKKFVSAKAPLKSESLFAVKIVTKARKASDNQSILDLYPWWMKLVGRANLIAFCLGTKGEESRVSCLFLGSPLSYVSLPGEPVAEGQLDIEKMRGEIDERVRSFNKIAK